MVFVWKYLISPLGGVFVIYEQLPAFLTSLLVCVVVSLVTPAPSAEIEAEFEAAKLHKTKKRAFAKGAKVRFSVCGRNAADALQ